MAEEKKLYTFYKIVCKDENIKDCYVGKTINLKERKRCHKKKCNNENYNDYNLKVYQFIRENGGFDNYIFVELEKDYYCEKDSGFRERFWIDELKSSLNSKIPTRTHKEYFKEYYKENKEDIKKKHMEYYEKTKINYEKNKDEINRRRRERRKEKRENKLSNENIE